MIQKYLYLRQMKEQEAADEQYQQRRETIEQDEVFVREVRSQLRQDELFAAAESEKAQESVKAEMALLTEKAKQQWSEVDAERKRMDADRDALVHARQEVERGRLDVNETRREYDIQMRAEMKALSDLRQELLEAAADAKKRKEDFQRWDDFGAAVRKNPENPFYFLDGK